MGRARKTENEGLPPGFIIRKRGQKEYYYLSRAREGRREEVPLGVSLSAALKEHRRLTPYAPQPLLDGDGYAHELFLRARKGAKQRGIPFELSVEDVSALLSQSELRCAITDVPFDLARREGARRRLWLPSLDRIDCKGAYTLGNVRVVASAVNVAMSDFGEEFLVQIAHAILRKQRRQRAELRNFAELSE